MPHPRKEGDSLVPRMGSHSPRRLVTLLTCAYNIPLPFNLKAINPEGGTVSHSPALSTPAGWLDGHVGQGQRSEVRGFTPNTVIRGQQCGTCCQSCCSEFIPRTLIVEGKKLPLKVVSDLRHGLRHMNTCKHTSTKTLTVMKNS